MILTANNRTGPTAPTSELASIPQHRPAPSQLTYYSCPVDLRPQPATVVVVHLMYILNFSP